MENNIYNTENNNNNKNDDIDSESLNLQGKIKKDKIIEEYSTQLIK